MPDYSILTLETGRKLKELMRSGKRGVQPKKFGATHADEPPRAGPTVRNDSGEEIPAYGVMRVTGIVTEEDREYYKVDKPGTTFSREYLVNGPVAIGTADDEKYGTAQLGPRVQALFDDADGTPTAGDGYGPKPGQWSLAKNYPETALVAGPHGDGATLLAEWHVAPSRRGSG